MAVMTENFVSAAALMSKVLGMPEFDFGIIEHPVSSADDAGLEQRASVTADSIARLVLKPEAA